MKKTKEPLDEGENRRVRKLAWNSTLKKNKTKIMSHGPITSRQKVEVETYFIFLGSKITVDGDYSHEM